MALTKIPRGLLDTGIADSSDSTAITIDSSENVTVAGHIRFADDKKTIFGAADDFHIYHTGGHNYIDVSTSDQDLIIKGTDGGSDITALTFDMSEGGIATFAAKIHANKGVNFYTTDDQANFWVQYTHTDDSLRFNYNGLSDDEIVVNTSGMVGIGTTSPDVNSFGTGHGVLTVQSATGSAKTAMLNLSGDGNDTDATRVASLFFNDASATGAGKSLAGVEAYRASNHATDPGGDLLFSTNVSGGSYTERMRIQADGKVGIGETTPLGQLHVRTADSGATADASADELVLEGSANSGMSILSGASNSGSIYFGDSGSNWDGYIAYSQANRQMTIASAQGGNYIYLDSTGHAGFSTTPTAWSSGYKSIQIGARGFVGAHTGSDLYLGQNAYVDSSWKYEASVAASLTQHSGGQITHFVAPAGTAGNAISWTTAMHIDTGGRVGIKTNAEADGTAMTSPLTISGANDGGNIFESHRTGNSIHRQYMSTGGSSYIDIYGTTPILKFRIGGSDVLDIRADRLDGIHFYAGTTEITSTMDNLKTSGMYRIQNNAGGQPISATYGAACVFGNQGNVTTQIWSPLQSSTLYVRSFNNAWSSWTQL